MVTMGSGLVHEKEKKKKHAEPMAQDRCGQTLKRARRRRMASPCRSVQLGETVSRTGFQDKREWPILVSPVWTYPIRLTFPLQAK